MAIKKLAAPPSIGRQLVFAAATGKAVCSRLLEPHGLSLAQWAVLSSIWRNGPLNVKALAEMTGNAPPAVSRLVDRMIAGGLLIRKQDDQDRRAVVIGLSEKGEALRPLQGIYQEVNAILLAELSVEDHETLQGLLHRLDQTGRSWLSGNGAGPASGSSAED
jgi:DNA-binding MarR family transcriptional regulator